MRNSRLLLVWYVLFASISCKKDYQQQRKGLTIEEARSYFEKIVIPTSDFQQATINNKLSPRKSLRVPIWNKAYAIPSKFESDAVVVPLTYANPFFFQVNEFFSAKDLIRLVIYKDSNNEYHAELITSLPERSNSTPQNGGFEGVVLVDDWNGNPIKILKYKHGKVEKAIKNAPGTHLETGIWYQYEIRGYNYSPEFGDYYGWSEVVYVYVETSNDLNSYDDYDSPGAYDVIDYGGTYAGGPVGTIEPENLDMFTVAFPERPIGNILDYLKCFDNNPSSDHKYSITICVAQPNPGSRDTWAFRSPGQAIEAGNPVLVGHTFIVLKEETPSKTTVRNIGLYPANFVAPTSPATQGVLGNDEQHEYNISLTVSVTSSNFTNAVNYISQGYYGTYTYNLNTNNCTTFAGNVMAAANVILPRTFGTWTNGSGMNPGDMGEDIRSLSLSSNMVRNTVGNNHPNGGNCY